jgi:hypothetical protein
LNPDFTDLTGKKKCVAKPLLDFSGENQKGLPSAKRGCCTGTTTPPDLLPKLLFGSVTTHDGFLSSPL